MLPRVQTKSEFGFVNIWTLNYLTQNRLFQRIYLRCYSLLKRLWTPGFPWCSVTYLALELSEHVAITQMTNTLRYFCGWGLEYFPHFPFCLFNREGLSHSFSFPVKSLKCILHQNTMSNDVKSYRASTVLPKLDSLYNLLFWELMVIWGWTRNRLTGTRLCMSLYVCCPKTSTTWVPLCKTESWGQSALKTLSGVSQNTNGYPKTLQACHAQDRQLLGFISAEIKYSSMKINSVA